MPDTTEPRDQRATIRRRRAVLLIAAALWFAPHSAPSRADEPRLGRVVRGFRSPGNYPEGLAYDGQHLWCNNYSNATLYKIDPATGQKLKEFWGGVLPIEPEGLTWDGQYVWTADFRTGAISRIREESNRFALVDRFYKPADSGPAVGLGWDGTHLWLTCWPGGIYPHGQIYKIDPTSYEVLWSRELDVTYIEDLAWDGHYFWSTDWLAGIVFAIDPASGDTLHTFRAPGPNPVGTAWDGTYLWLTCTSKDSIWAVDVSAAFTTPVAPQSWTDLKQRYRR